MRPSPTTPRRILSFADTRKLLDEPSAVDPKVAEVAMHKHFAKPILNIVLLLLGLPFVLGTESKGTFGGLVVCVAICAAFYGIHLLCGELGHDRTVSAAAAAWLPIAMFAPLGLYLFDNVNT